MAAKSIGLPSLQIAFEAAAEQTANRSKRGYVGVIIRDEKAQGVHVLTDPEQIPTELGEANRAYLERAFVGSDRGAPSRVTAVVAPPSEDEAEAAATLEAALKSLESMSLDYVAGPPDITAAEKTLLQTWVEGRRAAHHTEKLVLPNAAAPDSMGVVNFDESTIQVGARSYTAAEYASRIAGILAGIPSGMSSTYAPLPEVTAVTPRTEAEAKAAVDAGKLILLHDGTKAKIARGVNSLTTIPPQGSEDWRKIKIVEGMDLIRYFLRTTIEDNYVGKYPNTYDNKCVLVTAVTEYLTELEGKGVLMPGTGSAEIPVTAQRKWLTANGVETTSMTDQEIREADTGSWVFLRSRGLLVDAMEDFNFLFTTL